jgi:hypothetical protein
VAEALRNDFDVRPARFTEKALLRTTVQERAEIRILGNDFVLVELQMENVDLLKLGFLECPAAHVTVSSHH